MIGQDAMTTSKRKEVEVFVGTCQVCRGAVDLVRQVAGDSCTVTVLDANDPMVILRARKLGIERFPAVVVDGKLAEGSFGLDARRLRAAGVGGAV